MKRLVLLAPVALLAGCSGESSVSLQPGQWETTVQFTDIQVPGAPKEALAPLRAMMGQPQTRSECITPEEAANPMGKMMAPDGSENACQFANSRFAGGTIEVRGTCQDEQRGTMTMTMDGSYTATTMEARVSTQVQAPEGQAAAGPQSMTMSGTFRSRRTGECPSS